MDDRTSNEKSRRNFLKKATRAGAAGIAGALGLNVAAPHVLPEKMVFGPNRSFWARELPPPNAPLEKDLDVDVAIIGGGFTGLSAAYYLRKTEPNRSVAVLEAHRCGNGASARNGAMMLNMTEDRFLQWSGEPELDQRIYALTLDNIQRLQALSAETGIDADIEQNGALQVFNTKSDKEKGTEFIAKIRPYGLPFEYWDQAKVSQAIGTTAYEGALFDPGSGQLHPGKLVALFKRAAQLAGAQIFEGTVIAHVEEGEQLRLTTADGRRVLAKAVILATNAFTSKLNYLRRAVAPFFDYVGITAPLSDAKLAATGWGKRIPFNDSRTEVFYLGQTKDRRIHVGGGLADYEFNNGVEDPSRAETRYQGLRRELRRIYPMLESEPLEVCWSGAVDMSLDQTPSVGQIGKHGNVYYAIGFSGHGVNLTSVFGRILADLVGAKESEWQWLPYLNRLPTYMPNEPFRWLGVQFATEYYRFTESL
jgi:glycine/D-amino acid oxidase-like deaminating enzyme